MRKGLMKTISYLLVFALLFQAVPVYAFVGEKVIDKKYNEPAKEEHQLEKRKIVREITSKREENKKYFEMSDGSEKVNTYATQVHLKEGNKYVEINNELVSTGDIYENKKAAYKVKYEKQNSDNSLMELEKDGYTLSMSLNDSKKVKATIPKEEIKNNVVLEKEEIVSNISSELEYNEIKNNVDITYTTLPNKVKESIILKEKNSDKVFEYQILTNKPLVATIKEHNIIEFTDNNIIIFSIDTPYMYDQEFDLSTDIVLKLDKIEGGYNLTITPNHKWLNDKNRKYPVVIDPTVVTNQIRNQIDDLFIYEGDENVDPYAKANQHILRVGSNRFPSTNANPTRSLIRFNLPTLNTGDQVIEAELALYSYACSLESGISCPAGKPIEINAHKVTKDWNDNNAKWSHLGGNDSYNPQVVDYQIFNFDWNDQVKLYQFNITSIVKDWYISGKNSGLMLKENNEVKNLQREDAYFFSSDINDKYASARPIASITYRNQTGLENHQTFTSHSVGRFDVNVNNYNGNFVLTHNDLSTPGERLPITINHVYNTNDKDTNIGFGNGFRLNLNQTLVLDGNNIKYIDEDGTRHWFIKEENKYVDEDGLDLTIMAGGNNYRLEDKEGNTSYFTKRDSTWYLTEVKDTSNNKITINLDSNNYITSVSDASGDILTLTYNNNLLTKMTDSANRVINYNYVDSNITSVNYPNNTNQSIEYSNKLITKIVDTDNSYNTYEYYTNSPYRLKKINEFGTNGGVGNTLEFVYGENITSIKDDKGKQTNYLFNNQGLTTSITDLGDNITPTDAYGQEYIYNTSEGKNKNKLISEGNLIKTSNNANNNDILGAKNLIDNADFSEDLKGIVSETNIKTDDGIYSDNGNKTLKLNGEASIYKTFSKFIDLNGQKGDSFNFSFWALNTGVVNVGNKQNRLFFELIDSKGNYIQQENIQISPDNHEWQFINRYFVAKGDYVKVKLSFASIYQKGYVLFDNIGLYRDEIPHTYTYDGKGNVISSKDAAKQNNNYIYDSKDQMIMSINSKDRTTLYSYDHEHKNRLLRTFEQSGSETKYNYDNYGNQTAKQTYEKKQITLNDINPNKSYYLKTLNSELYISTDNIDINASKLKLSALNDNAKFQFKRTSDGLYEIFSANSKNMNVFDVEWASTADRTPMQLYPKNDTSS